MAHANGRRRRRADRRQSEGKPPAKPKFTRFSKPVHNWIVVVESYLSTARRYFDFTAEQSASELHRLTAGMYRALKDLLCEACAYAWHAGVTSKVTMNDVRCAYRSDGYTSHREDIETLAKIPTSAQARKNRPDLVSPFAKAIDEMTVSAKANSVPHKTAEASPVVRDIVESAISADGRKVLKELRDAAIAAPPDRKDSANVKKIRKRTPVTGASLLANLSLVGYGNKPVTDDHDR